MSKRTKWAVLIGAAAAVISAVVLIVLFWDRLLEKLPCCGWCRDEDWDNNDEDFLAYEKEELDDFADLSQPEAE